MSFQPARPRRTLPAFVFLLVIVIGGLAAAYFLRPRFEAQPPQISITPDAKDLGVGAPLEILVTDRGTGLKSVTATLSAGGTEHALASEQYGQAVPEKKVSVALDKIAGLKEGPALLRVTARDASLWKWFAGNETVVVKEFTIDVTPPQLELVADDRYVSFGGVGAIVYKASPDTATSGVRVGEHFFPGFPGQAKGAPDHFFALFAHPFNEAPETRAVVVATDKAGTRRATSPSATASCRTRSRHC
jgi:hypothetical protein